MAARRRRAGRGPAARSTPTRPAGPSTTSATPPWSRRRPDGSVVVELTVTNRDAFRSFVLGFLEHAEVLGPPELRDELVAWLGALA